MFDLAHMKRVKWPVKLVNQLADGSFEDVELVATFERLVGDELATFRREEREILMRQIERAMPKPKGAGNESASIEDDIASSESARRNLLLSRLKDWGTGIVDNGEPVPYSAAVAEALMTIKPVFAAFWEALVECSEKARPKTSPPLRAGSVADKPS